LAAAVVGLTLIALLLLARWMRARHQRTRSDLAEHVKLLLQAQTELREQSVRWQGTSSDELTGLPIRAGLNQALEQALGRAEREQLAVAVFFIDLDGFKAVNDSAGHDVGDAVLREVAKRLCKGLRHSDVVARLGGDEFVAVVEGPKSVIQAYRLGRKLIQRVSEPVAVNGKGHQVGASIGLALFPDDAADAAGLLKAADQAMYSAKRAGKGQCQLSSAAHQATVSAHLAMEASLRDAIGCGTVSLRRSLWQTLAEEQAVGQEVAPHWQHEGRWQPVIPSLTLTDDAELMTQFDRWQLRQAVRAALESPGVPGADGAWMMVPLASAAAAGVALDDWPDRVRDLLAEEGLPPQRLVLQLPARWLCDEHRSLDALTRLRARGVRIAFLGVGEREVPLRRLIEAPVDWLIVDAAAAAQVSSALVRALAAVGAQCGFQLAAQGLDSPERRRWAGAAGCVIGSLTAVESP
jgi:diguanylate cyclase (GGDEF)-like protein